MDKVPSVSDTICVPYGVPDAETHAVWVFVSASRYIGRSRSLSKRHTAYQTDSYAGAGGLRGPKGRRSADHKSSLRWSCVVFLVVPRDHDVESPPDGV